MIVSRYNGIYVQLTFTSIIFIVNMLMCSSAQSTSLQSHYFEPQPVYRQGTTFVYSDGRWETVSATAPNAITWKNHRGNISTGTPDFTRRRMHFQTRTRQGTRTFGPRKNIIVRRPESIWPLKIGKKASYTETGNWIDKRDNSVHSYSTHWSCEVKGTERIAVPAGEFDTWKIVCSRYNTSRSSRSRLREIKTWNYAPQIGHYVSLKSRFFYNKPSRRLELLAVLPPRGTLPIQAQKKMDKSFQKALEHKVSGSSTSWSMAGAALSGRTTPYGTFKLQDGTFCRRYTQDLDVAGDLQSYYGIACRVTKDKWIVPRR